MQWKRTHEIPPSMTIDIDLRYGKKCPSLLWCSQWWVAHALADSLSPMLMKAALLNLSGSCTQESRGGWLGRCLSIGGRQIRQHNGRRWTELKFTKYGWKCQRVEQKTGAEDVTSAGRVLARSPEFNQFTAYLSVSVHTYLSGTPVGRASMIKSLRLSWATWRVDKPVIHIILFK